MHRILNIIKNYFQYFNFIDFNYYLLGFLN